jgi:dienelactone hydrolase
MPTSPTNVRRSRLRVSLGVIAMIALAAAAAVVVARQTSPAARSGASTSTGTRPSTTARPSTTTTTRPRLNTIGTYRVATTSLTVLVAGLASTDDRLPTTVWYPVPKASAPHAAARRRFPLLVFSEGFAVPVASYAGLITDWASAGFVVAGPTYPHTSPTTPTTLDRADLVHHPGDLATVIATVIDAGRERGSVLSGRIDANAVGLVGQSDGGDVSLALVDNSCCKVAGVKAAAILSGAEYAGFGGQYFAPGTSPNLPLLVVQGTNDTVNPPVCSAQLYDAASPPKFYLDLFGATHLAPYTEPSRFEPVVAAVTTEFFDAALLGERGALVRMAASGDVYHLAELTSGPSAPAASGTCPTAPEERPTAP